MLATCFAVPDVTQVLFPTVLSIRSCESCCTLDCTATTKVLLKNKIEDETNTGILLACELRELKEEEGISDRELFHERERNALSYPVLFMLPGERQVPSQNKK